MFTSAVLRLRLTDASVTVPVNLGRAAHALALTFIGIVDPDLAATLHGGSGPKPFTVSNLFGPGVVQAVKPRRDTIRPAAGPVHTLTNTTDDYFLRITALNKHVSDALAALSNKLPPELTLGNAHFAVKGLAPFTGEPHPLASRVAPATLIQTHLLGATTPDPKLRLYFGSPTTFRLSQGSPSTIAKNEEYLDPVSQEPRPRQNMTFPLPGLVFGSLLDRWNATVKESALHPDLRLFATECLGIQHYDLRTEKLSFPDQFQIGFVGVCEYAALNHDRYWLRLLNLLLDFAPYSGVGHKTTMGMGQIW